MRPQKLLSVSAWGSDFLLVIAVDDCAVLGDDEGMGVVFGDDGAQAADFVFGLEDAGVFGYGCEYGHRTDS